MLFPSPELDVLVGYGLSREWAIGMFNFRRRKAGVKYCESYIEEC